MKTYRLKVKPDIRYAVGGFPRLTEGLLMQSVEGIAVRELGETRYGEQIVDVRLQRPTEQEALEELVTVLQQFGFSLVEVTVSRWLNQMVAKAVVSLGTLALGTGLSKKPAVGLAYGALTFLAVSAIETEAYTLLARYEARRDYVGTWTFRQLP